MLAPLGVNRLCSATFKQLFAFWATFSILATLSNLRLSEQFLSNFVLIYVIRITNINAWLTFWYETSISVKHINAEQGTGVERTIYMIYMLLICCHWYCSPRHFDPLWVLVRDWTDYWAEHTLLLVLFNLLTLLNKMLEYSVNKNFVPQLCKPQYIPKVYIVYTSE